MVVAGAPEATPNHSVNVCDMGIDMIKSVRDLIDPSTGRALGIRIGKCGSMCRTKSVHHPRNGHNNSSCYLRMCLKVLKV